MFRINFEVALYLRVLETKTHNVENWSHLLSTKLRVQAYSIYPESLIIWNRTLWIIIVTRKGLNDLLTLFTLSTDIPLSTDITLSTDIEIMKNTLDYFYIPRL